MKTGVYVLTGYLGSGKTTLLQKLLQYLRRLDDSVVVIMNEMGEEDIDGELLQAYGFPLKKLLDGCICCTIRGELTDGLQEIMRTIKPASIIIETTGVADPIDVVDAMIHPELYERIDLKGIISVVDSSRYLALTSRFESTGALVKTIRNQVKFADLILMNKVDLVSSEVIEKVKRKIREENAFAPLHVTIESETDLPMLFAMERVQEQAPAQSTRKAATVQKTIGRFSPLDKIKQSLGVSVNKPTLFNSIDSFSYRFTGPVHEGKFEAFLLNLPESVYRAKGYVSFAGKQESVSFQHTETQVMFVPLQHTAVREVAVFIGEGMNKGQLICDLEKCYV